MGGARLMLMAIGKRILAAIPLLWAVVTLTFVLLTLAPGDIVTATLGDYPATEEYLAERRAELGLDQPVFVQYLNYLWTIVQGDLGYSFASRQEVLPLVLDRLGPTLLLVTASTLLALLVGVPIGLWAATSRSRFFDGAVNLFALLAFSIPTFWLALMGVLIFSLQLGWLPSQGMTTIGFFGGPAEQAMDVLGHLILPAVVLAIPETALFTRMARTSATDVLDSGFVLTAVSKGLRRTTIVRRHVTRNSLLPVVTVAGYSFGTLVGGSVLIETVFGWPGMGSLLYESVGNRDTQVVLGVLIVVAVLTVVINLVTDLAYGLINPTIREASAL